MQSIGHMPAFPPHPHPSPSHQHQRRWSSGGGGGGGHMSMADQQEMLQQGMLSSASAAVSTALPRLSLPPPPPQQHISSSSSSSSPPPPRSASGPMLSSSAAPTSPHQQNQHHIYQQQQLQQHHHHHHHHQQQQQQQQYIAPYHGPMYNGGQVPTHHHPHRGSHIHGGRHSGQIVASSRPPHPISDDERDEIRMAFELFDTKKCGRITYRELKLAMRALDFDVKKADVKNLMEDHTKDGNTDEVDMDEFMEILSLKYKERDPNEELAKAFKIFDEDETGKITLKNLRKVARDLGEHITDEELGSMIEEFDNDQDGGINEEEFFNIMRKDDFDD